MQPSQYYGHTSPPRDTDNDHLSKTAAHNLAADTLTWRTGNGDAIPFAELTKGHIVNILSAAAQGRCQIHAIKIRILLHALRLHGVDSSYFEKILGEHRCVMHVVYGHPELTNRLHFEKDIWLPTAPSVGLRIYLPAEARPLVPGIGEIMFYADSVRWDVAESAYHFGEHFIEVAPSAPAVKSKVRRMFPTWTLRRDGADPRQLGRE